MFISRLKRFSARFTGEKNLDIISKKKSSPDTKFTMVKDRNYHFSHSQINRHGKKRQKRRIKNGRNASRKNPNQSVKSLIIKWIIHLSYCTYIHTHTHHTVLHQLLQNKSKNEKK